MSRQKYSPLRVRIVSSFDKRHDYQETDLGKVPNGGTEYEARMYGANNILRGTLSPRPIESLKADLVSMKDLIEGAVSYICICPEQETSSQIEPKFRRAKRIRRRALEEAFGGDE
ncbi:MAG: hypothetical protein AABX53_03670 [Nanoarchaeota archaeon]